jgi:predicted HAD superfamily Cof-like phosphohydrolase
VDNFTDVGDFHRKFGLANVTWNSPGPTHVTPEIMKLRVELMDEELQEFKDAFAENDDVKMFDALLDLVYVAMGTAHVRGYPWQRGWDVVQTANMNKERSRSNGDARSKRQSQWDVVKPEGWTPPDIQAILRQHGFNV